MGRDIEDEIIDDLLCDCRMIKVLVSQLEIEKASSEALLFVDKVKKEMELLKRN